MDIGQAVADSIGNFIASNLPVIFLSLATLALFILIIRELVTWYWKINNILSLLEKIEKNTRPKDEQ